MKPHHWAIAFCITATSTVALADSLHNFPQQQADTVPSSAASRQDVSGWQAQTGEAAPVGKTREQVIQELIQAERDGLVPTSRSDYPPSDRLIELNKERYTVRQRVAREK
ncbi:DUF4148 domain-containing protein [Caballeronia sp. M23-90]